MLFSVFEKKESACLLLSGTCAAELDMMARRLSGFKKEYVKVVDLTVQIF